MWFNCYYNPKILNLKKYKKNRKFKFFSNNYNLKFGNTGLFVIKSYQLSSKKIVKLKLFLKKSIKKSIKTRRKFWLNVFPNLPLSKKALGSRMGKGKGKLNSWFISLHPGFNILEFINLRKGRSVFFLKQVNFWLGYNNKIISKSNFYFKLPLKNFKFNFKQF